MSDDLQSQMQALVDALCALDHDSAVTVITSVLQARPELAPPVINFSVPDLTYPPAKALLERRCEGSIKSFNETKGFGFIDCQELNQTFGNDVFLHHSQLGSFAVGQYVTFAVMLSKDNRPQGYDLQPGDGGHGGHAKGGYAPAKGGAKGASNGHLDWGAAAKGGAAPSKGKAVSSKGGGGMLGPTGKGKAMAAFGGTYGGPSKGGKGGKDDGKSKGTQLHASLSEGAEFLGEFEGSIKSFNSNNGYGFIDCQELKGMYGNDTFLHHSDLGGCSVGDAVTFQAFLNSAGKPQAKEVQAAGAPAAKRARV